MFLGGPGVSFESIMSIAPEGVDGPAAVEGLSGWGAWNSKSSDKAKAFADEWTAYFGPDGDNTLGTTVFRDWWGQICYYAVCEILGQAIEGAGTLDNAKVAQYIKDNHFDTVLGDTWFENQMLAADCYYGQVGQWQSGVFEVIDVGARRTADPIVPKPTWAK
jgi:ABC-type branched-subunit amino acid transport system substrate-binding protein